MGTPKMQIAIRSSAIGGSPRPEIRGTERREAGREIFGETIAEALGGRKVGSSWMARCPTHDDQNPSLRIADCKDGRVLVYPKGIWDVEDELPLYEDPNNSAADGFLLENSNFVAAHTIALTPIDMLVQELRQFSDALRNRVNR